MPQVAHPHPGDHPDPQAQEGRQGAGPAGAPARRRTRAASTTSWPTSPTPSASCAAPSSSRSAAPTSSLSCGVWSRNRASTPTTTLRDRDRTRRRRDRSAAHRADRRRACCGRRATGPRRRRPITVRLSAADGGALISVEDPEPSSDASLSPVVQRFAEMQGGWATVESREGGGSSFSVFLPDGAGVEGPGARGAASDQAGPDEGALHIVVEGVQESASASGSVLVDELHRLSTAED